MPVEAYWATLFDVALILDRLGIDARLGDVTELGCGMPRMGESGGVPVGFRWVHRSAAPSTGAWCSGFESRFARPNPLESIRGNHRDLQLHLQSQGVAHDAVRFRQLDEATKLRLATCVR